MVGANEKNSRKQMIIENITLFTCWIKPKRQTDNKVKNIHKQVNERLGAKGEMGG